MIPANPKSYSRFDPQIGHLISMCGIAGAIALKSNAGNLSDPLDRIVERMSQHLTHRGPDASGLWNSPSGLVALAHRRLAIIDLTDSGRQPMAYAERFWVTFNGEIYNSKDSRSQLRERWDSASR